MKIWHVLLGVALGIAPTCAQSMYYYDCYTDAADGGPALDGAVYIDHPGMRYEACGQFCLVQHNYTLLGLRNGGECHCGYELRPGAAIAQDPSECNMVCRGNSRSICGSETRMNLLGVQREPPTEEGSFP